MIARTTTIEHGSGRKQVNIASPLKALRAKCIDCSGGNLASVRDCPVTDCPLYPYRLGKNPFYKKRVMSDEERAAASERMKKVRQNRSSRKI